MTEGPICEEGGSGLILPLFADEHTWPKALRGILYALALIYFFFGVSIIADIFMAGIEEITGQRRKVRRAGKLRTETVWNATIANLSLMALGSSAPEICLAIIETCRNRFYSGELGSSTIVGSAAFNLFVIVAVCLVSIPDGEERKIVGISVYYVTAAFSLWAYIWLVIALNLISPERIEVWEALVTLLNMPLLLGASWYIDTRGFDFGRKPAIVVVEQCNSTEEAATKDLAANNTQQLKSIQVSKNIRASVRASHKHQAIRTSIGMRSSQAGMYKMSSERSGGFAQMQLGRSASWGSNAGVGSQNSPATLWSGGNIPIRDENPVAYGRHLESPTDDATMWDSQNSTKPKHVVQFLTSRQEYSASLKTKRVCLVRAGYATSERICIRYSVHECDHQPPAEVFCVGHRPTTQNNATTGSELLAGEVFIERDEGQTFADIPCRSDNFIVVIRSVNFQQLGASEGEVADTVGIGAIRSTYVIKAANSPGVLSFCLDPYATPEGETCVSVGHISKPQRLQVVVLRRGGCLGTLECTFRTEKFTAMPGVDFEAKAGVLQFAEGVTEQVISVDVMGKSEHRVSDEFLVILQGHENVKFDEGQDGGDDENILTVKLSEAPGCSSVWKRLDRLFNLDSIHLGNSEWIDQFKTVMFVNGSLEEQREAAMKEWIAHILALPWKLLFTLVPPTAYLGGWFCFMSSLVWIGGITTVIADEAEIFGCVAGIGDMVTAISFVALGTSMPDLFASLSAAAADPTADASVVNVTGSNSVNVFLGLGLPWTIASIYWEIRGDDAEWSERYFPGVVDPPAPFLYVPAEALGFSVGLFSAMCIVDLGILLLRRRALGCELGGPKRAKWTSGGVMVFFWLLYIALAGWYDLHGSGNVDPSEVALVLGLAALVFLGATGVAVIVICTSPKPADAIAIVETCDKPIPADYRNEDAGSEEPEEPPEIGDVTLLSKKCTGGDLSKEWSQLMSHVPPHHVKVIDRDLSKVKEGMQEANFNLDDTQMDMFMVKGAEMFCPVFATALDISASSVMEILQTLTLAPASSATQWFQGMSNIASAIGHERRLTKAMLSEADKISVGNKMLKVCIGIRMAKLGVPCVVVDRVRDYDSSLRGMPVTFMDTEGEDSMRMLEQVARLLGVDFQKGMLRPIIQERLQAWGLNHTCVDAILNKVSDEQRAVQMRAEICRAFLCDRPTAWDIAQFAVALKVDPRDIFYRPILLKHLSCLGFQPEVAKVLGDRVQIHEEVTKLQRLLDQAIQRPFWAPPDMWTAVGFDVVAAVGKSCVEFTLMRAGMLEDDALRVVAQLDVAAFAEVREAVMSLLPGLAGLSLSHFEELGETFDMNPRETLLKPLIRGRLIACGVPLERAGVVSESVVSMATLSKVQEQLSRMGTPEELTVEDLINFGKALGINFVINLLVPLITEKLRCWGVPQCEAQDFAKRCSKAGMLGNATVCDLMTTLFLHERGRLEELGQLAAETSAPVDHVYRAIKKAALVRLLVPDSIADSMTTKAAFGLEDEIDAITKPLMQKGEGVVDVEDLIELAKGTDVGATEDVLRPMFRSWLFYRGVRADALHLAASKVTSAIFQRDATCKRAFSESILGNKPTVEFMRVLSDGFGIDSCTLLGPMLHRRLVEWHVPATQVSTIVDRAASVDVQEQFDVLVFGTSPSAAKLSELCNRLGVPSPLPDMLTAWLISHGAPKDEATRAVSNAVRVEEQLLFTASSDDFKKPDVATAAFLVRSALPDFLREWGFSEDEATRVGERCSELRGEALVEHIAESLVLRHSGRVEDLEQLCVLARMDVTSLLHPIVRHRVLPLCVSMADANKVADESCSKSRLPLTKGLISRVLLRGQPSQVDTMRFLQSCGVSTAGLDMAFQGHTFSEPDSPHQRDDRPSTGEPEPEMVSPTFMGESCIVDTAHDLQEVEVTNDASPIKKSLTAAKNRRKSTRKSLAGPPKAVQALGHTTMPSRAEHGDGADQSDTPLNRGTTSPSRRGEEGAAKPERSSANSSAFRPSAAQTLTPSGDPVRGGDSSKQPLAKKKKKSIRKTLDRADAPALESEA